MRKSAFVYDEQLLARVMVEDVEFNPSRLQYTYELLSAYGAFELPGSTLVVPNKADEDALLSFHSPEYVTAVQSFSRGERRFSPADFNFSNIGDTQTFPGMYDVSTMIVGGSLEAADLVAEGKRDVVFNSSGGGHHVARGHASGFCVFNDVVIAVKHLLEKGLKVAYVDIDAHHGDGVQGAFYETDRVLTVSLHQTGQLLFPGTGDVSEVGSGAGKGYSVNVPLAPYTDNDIYLWTFDQLVPPLVGNFEPDVLVTQLGCDTHYLDPLTQLSLTTEGYVALVRRLSGMVPKWLALGGGGYEVSVVARCWTLAYGVMLGVDWPDEIPSGYQELYGLKRLRDTETPRLSDTARRRARRFAEETVAAVKRLVFPYHGL